MTNGVVVQYADRVEGRTLYMKYSDGAAAINVPAGTQIRRLVTVRLGDLKPGMRLTARGAANPDGTMRASSITFDRPAQGHGIGGPGVGNGGGVEKGGMGTEGH